MSVNPDPIKPGAMVTYSFTVSNRGTGALSSVVLEYLMPQHLGSEKPSDGGSCSPFCDPGYEIVWNIGTLLAGQTRTVFVAGEISSYAPDGTLIPNTAQVSASGGQSAAVSRTLVVDTQPVLMVGVLADREPVEPGGYLVYTLPFANIASVSAPGSVLSATVPAGSTFVSAGDGGVHSGGVVTWSLGNLAPGSNGQRQFTVQVSPGAVEGRVVASEVEIHDGSSPQNTARASVVTPIRTLANTPLTLSLNVSPNPIKPGRQVTYTLSVANRGNTDLTGVLLEYLMPQHLGSEKPSDGGSCSPFCDPGYEIVWNIGTLLAGESRTVLVAGEISSYTPDGTLIANTARVSASGEQSAAVSRTLVVDTQPVLMVGAQADREPVEPGGYLIYTLPFANSASVSAPGSVLSATVPAGSTFVSAGDGGVHSGGVVTWSLGDLAPGSNGQRQFTIQVSPGAVEGRVVASEVEIHDGSSPQNSARASVVTPVRTLANTPLTISLAVSPNPIKPSNQVTYTLSVTNRGNQDLTGVLLEFLIPPHLSSESPTDGGTCTPFCDPGYEVRWNLGTLLAGQSRVVFMTATIVSASSAPPDGTLISSPARVSSASGYRSSAFVTLILHRTITVATPSGFSANTVTSSSVALTWSPVSGATGYEIYRSSGNGAYASVKTVGAVGNTTDTGLATNTTYLYKVRAVGVGSASFFSGVDPATTVMFVDDPLGGVIRSVHVQQLRTAINAMRAAAGLASAMYSHSAAAGSVVRSSDVTEMRSALAAARATIGLPAVAYTDALHAGFNPVKGVHLVELRNAVK